MDSSALLKKLKFGSSVAEDDEAYLRESFMATLPWSKLIEGEVDLLFGAKGSGKSALYFRLVQLEGELRSQRAIHLIQAENPSGNAVFASLRETDVSSDTKTRILWKLYFLALSVEKLLELGDTSAEVSLCKEFLRREGLLIDPFRRDGLLSSILTKLPHFKGVTLGASADGTYTTSVEFGKQDVENPEVFVDGLLHRLNHSLISQGNIIWIALDRLDAAFDQSSQVEECAIRSLFRTYRDMRALSCIRLKIFLRDDIWNRILRSSGFAEASHLTRDIKLQWTPEDLLSLIAKRLKQNTEFLSLLGFDSLDFNIKRQEELFYRVFPKKMGSGANQASTFDWMLKRLQDAHGRATPRDFILMLSQSRDAQIVRTGRGELLSTGPIISREAVIDAWKHVSKEKLQKEVYAEHHELRSLIEKLRSGKGEYPPSVLMDRLDHDQNGVESLIELGLLWRSPDALRYSVARVFRPALDIRQGSARSLASGTETVLKSSSKTRANTPQQETATPSKKTFDVDPTALIIRTPEIEKKFVRLAEYAEGFSIDASELDHTSPSWSKLIETTGEIQSLHIGPAVSELPSSYQFEFASNSGQTASLLVPSMSVQRTGKDSILLSSLSKSDFPIDISLLLDFGKKKIEFRVSCGRLPCKVSLLRSATQLATISYLGGRITLRNMETGRAEVSEITSAFPAPDGLDDFATIIDQLWAIQRLTGVVLTWPGEGTTPEDFEAIRHAFRVLSTQKDDLIVTSLTIPTSPRLLGSSYDLIINGNQFDLRIGSTSDITILGQQLPPQRIEVSISQPRFEPEDIELLRSLGPDSDEPVYLRLLTDREFEAEVTYLPDAASSE